MKSEAAERHSLGSYQLAEFFRLDGLFCGGEKMAKLGPSLVFLISVESCRVGSRPAPPLAIPLGTWYHIWVSLDPGFG